ncbi:FAD-dependent oxidoreductase [Xaviernesmea oryzae]|uniref:FAD dependent oxidoreductase n=1 Tax=Xaviernesmea oryzae TaxID=464029 RepID=A0A1X7DI99_9HYPH|nr:FAD-dependent oxidoreductase [Xaviernesmea oryzae]SMF15905.1 FAD dependent oxidoreductase [Xaviernesmea oryzae]
MMPQHPEMAEHAMGPASERFPLTPSVSIPVEDAGAYDVIVVGGGLSGVCAAVAAARTGARTLLGEALPFVGGNGTTGLPISGLCARNSDRMIVGGIVTEIIEMLRKRGGVGADVKHMDWIPVDAEQLQLVLGDLLHTAGVTLLTYSPLLAVTREQSLIRDLCFYNKDGRALRYRAGAFVDSSGDAQLARLAGLTTPMGRQSDGHTQTMSLVFSVAGVDEARAERNSVVSEAWNQFQASRTTRNKRRDPSVNDVFGRPGWRSFIATRVSVRKGTDNRLLAEAELEGRRQIEEFIDSFLRPVAGYENCFLAQIASHVGVRETRRISGLYEITTADLVAGRKFDDAIACNASSIEIHLPDQGLPHWEHLEDGDYYTVPYRALVAREVDNLFTSGRCISATHEALAALRVLSPAMATGQAAGTAAALSALRGVAANRLDVAELRATLRAAGAVVE